MARRYWHFHYGALGERILLGPHLRAMEMARCAREQGLDATLLVDDPGSGERDGIRLVRQRGFDLGAIRPGDAVLVSEAAPARVPYFLARRGIAFHADCYGLVPPELVQIYRSWTPRHAWIDRVRRNIRYQFVAHHAERIYLSHPGQLMLMAGMVFAGGQKGDPEVVDGLPRKVSMIPMGVRTFPSGIPENPYPPGLHGRPVFLWGGGVWAWFDMDTLLDAFAEASGRGSDAALFFLSGKDHSGSEVHRAALERVKARAQELGLLGTSVFLNDKSVGPADLPGYIEHCRAGIMANPHVLESMASWRTRFLDLIAGGRPLVLAGNDPLGDRMIAAGAALGTPSGDWRSMADSICALAADAGLAAKMGGESAHLREALSWEANLAPLRDTLRDPESFRSVRRPGWGWLLRYFLSPYGPRWT
ncbi:MAG TPA: glycosyltransferase [Fibrobacteria bacterium]|nr:glycosyltransferase [Fibrobacteria bacterium]